MVYFITILYTATVLASWGYACERAHLTLESLFTEIILLDFSLWLKSLKNPDGSQRWDVAHINVIPSGGYVLFDTILCTWPHRSCIIGKPSRSLSVSLPRR